MGKRHHPSSRENKMYRSSGRLGRLKPSVAVNTVISWIFLASVTSVMVGHRVIVIRTLHGHCVFKFGLREDGNIRLSASGNWWPIGHARIGESIVVVSGIHGWWGWESISKMDRVWKELINAVVLVSFRIYLMEPIAMAVVVWLYLNICRYWLDSIIEIGRDDRCECREQMIGELEKGSPSHMYSKIFDKSHVLIALVKPKTCILKALISGAAQTVYKERSASM